MTKEIENIDSSNGENEFDLSEIDTIEDIEALKAKVKEYVPKITDSNRQLFARAKKAEGFEFKEGKWVKPPKEVIEKPDIIDKEPSKSDELDYGQKAFLRSYDIKGADEIALVKNWQKRTGDELDAIVEDDIFQAKLKSLRDARATNDALPKSNRRGTQPAPNDESYWTAKIESGQATLADIEDVDMRRKVLNKRVAKEKSGGKFSTTPIVMT